VTAISPFLALRYDESVAGPLENLVAPPYDVIEPDELEMLRFRSEYNIVHLTLPGFAARAGADLAVWKEKGVLREDGPALWWLVQDYLGIDGKHGTRSGIAGSIEATPYSEGKVLPHEATREHVKAERLEILRSTRTQLEPIFLIYDADCPVEAPGGDPEMDTYEGGVRSRLWRLPPDALEIDAPFVIADGHHRYETAVAFREEDPSATHTFAVLVSAHDPGLQIFPTHRIAGSAEAPPFGFMTSTWDMDSLAMYTEGNFHRIETDDDLDAREVATYELEGVSYTPDAMGAVQAVDDMQAQYAFLLRPSSVAQVLDFAERREAMPAKSTYFFPKLTSGLLLHPV
jgi:uncharacterized protein (DUF1015 family)